MGYKGFFLIAVFAVVFVSLLFTVSAVGIITNTTLNNSNISGTHLIYASLTTGCAADCYVGNVTFKWTWYNGTQVNISTNNNNTANDTTFSTSWDTTTFADGQNGTVNFSVYAYSGSVLNGTNSTTGIDLDNTPPITAAVGYTNATIKTATTQQLTLNISVSDATVGLLNSSNLFCFVDVNGTNNSIPVLGGWCNSSLLNLTGLTDGNKTIKIWINDTLRNNRTNNTLVVQIDTTAPTATATCSPSTIQTGDTFPCTCSGTDATSGVSTSSGSSTSGTITSTSSTGSFVFSCNVTDVGGLSTIQNALYSVTQPVGTGSGPGGSGSTTTVNPPSKVQSFSQIIPGVASIVKDFDSGTGLKQIQIEVNNPAQSVKVTVTKYDGKPAAVSVSKTGKVYQYMQINVSNVKDELNKATITAKVNKSWVSSNVVDKENIVVSKFDEANGKWDELDTEYSSEDDSYYYYTAEVTSFSYFAISEKAVVTNEVGAEGSDSTTTGASADSGSRVWVWVLVAVILVVLIWLVMKKRN